MSFLISSINISNFKSCKEVKVNLSNYTPFVGYNNAGKSNILNSIKWFIEGGKLEPNCFNDESKPIEVVVEIEGLSEKILEGLDSKQRASLTPYIVNGKISVKRVLEKPRGKKADQKYYVLDQSGSREWKVNPNGIEAGIRIIFPDVIQVGAMDNSEEDVTKFKTSNTIGKIISLIMSPIETAHGAEIQSALESVKEKLHVDGKQRAEEIKMFDTQASKILEEFFPGIAVKLHVPTPQIKDLFKTGTIKVFENLDQKDFSQLGHGTQRSIQMALLRYLSEIQQATEEEKTKTLLLIDEPELYLHPQAVEHLREALKKLSHEGFQVLFSTHSAQLIDESTISGAVLVRKSKEGGTFIRKTIKEAVEEVVKTLPHQAETLFELSNASEILFCEKVLLAEGKTEKALLPFLISKYHGKTLGQLKIALINQGGSGSTYKSMKVLDALDLPCKGVVDLDFVFKQAPSIGLILEDDPDLITCKEYFLNNAIRAGIELGEDGLPTKKGRLNASQSYEWLAGEKNVEVNILSPHNKLKEKNIWLWTKGAIEAHLEIEGKNISHWSKFKEDVEINGIESRCSDQMFNSFLNWIGE